MKIAEVAKGEEPGHVAHTKHPLLALLCLHSSILIVNMI